MSCSKRQDLLSNSGFGRAVIAAHVRKVEQQKLSQNVTTRTFF